MTVQQLRYAIMVAELGSITEAAKALFITPPSLSIAIKELEKEAGITIFNRSRSGISITNEGMEFLGYARQVTETMQSLLDHYVEESPKKTRFCVSAQHYTFSKNAFVHMTEQYGKGRYEFIFNETQTHQILKDVQNQFCDLGLMYLCYANKAVLTKAFSDMDLVFTPLFTVKPHVFVRDGHPLSNKRKLHFEDLAPYPRLSFYQGAYESPSFSEEVFSNIPSEKEIIVSDSAALEEFMMALDGYTIGSGIYPEQFKRSNAISLPLDEPEYLEIGYLLKRGRVLSELGNIFVQSLKRYSPGSSE